jgi:phosphohistidine phosphatase SixA
MRDSCTAARNPDYDRRMSEPLNRLRRRPLLAPLWLPILALLAAGAGIYWLGTWARTTVVVLVRHAETESAGAGDPDLNPAGEARVAGLGVYLADVLAGAKVDYLYAADTRRAQQTAAPVANQFGLPINLLASSDWDDLAGRIRRDHRGETVVVVGYASTIPGIVTDLSGETVALPDDDFTSVFVVVRPSPGDPRVLRLQYAVGASGSTGRPETQPASRKNP